MRRIFKKLLYITGFAVITGTFLQFRTVSGEFHENVIPSYKQLPPFLTDTANWVDSVSASLSLEEKIAQMIMVPAYPRKGDADKQRVAKLIRNYKVGGIIFFQGNPDQVAELSRYYQSISKVPLLIAIDGEWGLGMRLKNTISYPKQMMLGAITDEMLLYQMGRDIAKQLKYIGIHINFGPVVDINNNAHNPVINCRSFGESRSNVARKGILYSKGMQDEGVLAFAKHFPGHGDTETDSHHGLPIINHSPERLDSLELYPFKALIKAGVGGVMMAHMNVVSLDSTKNLPSTLSPLIVDSLLKKKLGYEGIIVTDAMEMKGVADYFNPVDANVRAVAAGNDILLMPANIEESIGEIADKVNKGEIPMESILASCNKLLNAKQWIEPFEEQHEFSIDSLNAIDYELNKKKLIEGAITVVHNSDDLLPLSRLDTLKIAHIAIGEKAEPFSRGLNLYTICDLYRVKDYADTAEINKLYSSLNDYNLIITSFHSNNIWNTTTFGVTDQQIAFVDSLLTRNYPVLLASFASPYALNRMYKLDKLKGLVVSYENDSVTNLVTAQVIFGALKAKGRLPVSIGAVHKEGDGVNTKRLGRLSYVMPEEVGISSDKIIAIDTIIAEAISEQATPGCQVLAARKGKVFFSKTYGYHTYSKRRKVDEFDLYDLASLTKISATLPAIMRLEKEKLIDIEDRLGEYLPILDTNVKGSVILKDILLHQAGLKAWIPFYWSTLEPAHPNQDLWSTRYSETYPIKFGKRAWANKHLRYKKEYFSTEHVDSFQTKVADHLYINQRISDSVWTKIYNTELDEPGHYRYSDLGFYLFSKIIGNISGVGLDQYVDSVFYLPLGAHRLCYNPLSRFTKEQIVPTENDLIFRKQLVHGYVHDPGAAMLGGVSGHAGLFGNANDLAKLMQLYLNGGTYSKNRYLSKRIISEYSKCGNCNNGNRRGIGFDKPQPDTTLPGPAFKGISLKSFGHTGFTGTMVWLDPDTDILYIFLSNRVYPDALNPRLVSHDIRTRVQKAIYDAML